MHYEAKMFKLVFNLPLYLQDTDTIADVTQVPVGVLTVIPEDRQQPGPHALHLEPSSIAIILEGNIVMDDIGSHAQAFCVTFGLIYALHLDYPKRLRNTFDFIQRVMLNLGGQPETKTSELEKCSFAVGGCTAGRSLK